MELTVPGAFVSHSHVRCSVRFECIRGSGRLAGVAGGWGEALGSSPSDVVS